MYLAQTIFYYRAQWPAGLLRMTFRPVQQHIV